VVNKLPEFLLVCETLPTDIEMTGRWHFRLESASGELLVEAEDLEAADPQRLALLSVVRGLEAIESPGRVTLITANRYVLQGMRRHLATWRDNGFRWEHYGRMLPVVHADLWRRVDRGLAIHQVQACWVSAACLSLGPMVANEPAATPMQGARWLSKRMLQPAAA
jgi:ribonuclease HI